MRPGARSEHPAYMRERIRPLTLPFKRTEGEESHDAAPALQRQLRRQDRHTVSGHQRLDVGRECAFPIDCERGFQSFAFHPEFNRRGARGYGKF